MGCSTSVPLQMDADATYYAPCPGESFAEKMVTLENGRKRHVVHWCPDDKAQRKGVIVVLFGSQLISHGLHEHAMRYYGVAHALTASNFAVYAMDHHAHGRSTDLKNKALIEDYRYLPEDLVCMSKYAMEQEVKRATDLGLPATTEALPMFLLGHSMGTMVGLLAALDWPNLKAIVLSGIGLKAGPSAASPQGIKLLYPLFQGPSAVHIAGAMARVDPRGPACPIIREFITTDRDALDLLGRDPFQYHGPVRNQTGHQVLMMINKVKDSLKDIKTPMYCVHGGADSITLPEGAETVINEVGTATEDKSLRIFDGGYHELFHEVEPTRSDCIKSVVQYFNDQLTSKPGIHLSVP